LYSTWVVPSLRLNEDSNEEVTPEPAFGEPLTDIGFHAFAQEPEHLLEPDGSVLRM
jgi:hypothetical protein